MEALPQSAKPRSGRAAGKAKGGGEGAGAGDPGAADAADELRGGDAARARPDAREGAVRRRGAEG